MPNALEPTALASAAQIPNPAQVLLLEIEGMKCGGCVRAVEQKLQAEPGVRRVAVNLLSRTAWLELEPGLPDLASLQSAVASLGFQVSPRSEPEVESLRARWKQQSWWQQWRQLVVALLLVLVSGLGHLALAGQLPSGRAVGLLADERFHALVATLALALPGRALLIRGGLGALHGVPSMDTLVGIGVLSAYLASWVGLLWPQGGWPCFFNEPVMLLGFVLLGRFLEERARYRTGRALEQLASLQPELALLLLGDDEPRPVRAAGLRPGDRLRLLPGDRVPVDAVVQKGRSAVDVSALTGEPIPILAEPGHELAAGSLNLEAQLDLLVRRSGRESAIARIIQLVEQAQARKAPIQGLADRISGRFSVLVLLLAAATLLFWWLWGAQIWPQVLIQDHLHAGGHGGHQVFGATASSPFGLGLQLAISVLVVACPCALGLATPTAIAVGIGRAARAGVLFRGGDAIETAARLRTVIFDKTGTLTLGRPLVSSVHPAPGVSEDRLLQVGASLEAGSRHPLAHALLQEAQARGLPLLAVEDSRAVVGSGVEGRVEGLEARVGRPDWLGVPGVDPPGGYGADTWLGVSLAGELLGLVAAADQPRGDAASTLSALRADGLKLGLLSGDREPAVRSLGARLGLDPGELAWELTPEQKLERLSHDRQGRSRPRPLAMVGDGINDAPALAAADLGIAVGTGTQIAQDTADLVVLGEGLEGLLRARGIARRTMVKVRQNLAWAFGYNLVVLPIAAGALLPGAGILLTPPLAALLMALSSITVVLNALLLQDGPHARVSSLERRPGRVRG
ncbi:MAG: cation-translocating P-type ATPase [Cyanobacteriota bacterium]|nr:cation-translocating P-type ATPase [Cyanobacteriota bacterium]